MGWAVVAAAWPLVASTGCMTVTLYEPMRAIHRPVVVEHSPENFSGLRILVRCLSHQDFLPPGDAAKLCGKVAEDFERQGAESAWVAPVGATFIDPPVFDGELPDLTVEIESKIDHAYDYPLTVVASCLTCTLVPGVSEQTFSQRVVVYGRDRSVLTEEVFRERFVEYNGCGVWSLNWVVDWIFRTKEQAVSGDVGKQDFTRDFYGQLRQLAFNARVRSEVLGLTAAPRRAPVVVPPRAAPATTTTTPATTPSEDATPDAAAPAAPATTSTAPAPAPPPTTPAPAPPPPSVAPDGPVDPAED